MRSRSPRTSLRAWLFTAFIAWMAVGSLPAAAQAPSGQGLQLVFENDVLGRGSTDRWYTNGLRVSWMLRNPRANEDPASTRALNMADSLLGAQVDQNAQGSSRAITWTLGQNMYTPRRIDLARPQRGDRPWAGWLYLGATAQGFKGDEFQQTDLKLGITGRASGAGQLQRWVHRTFEATYPAGWEQQLKSGVHAQLSHMRLWRLGDTTARDRVGFHGGAGVTVGSLRSYATALLGVVAGRLEGDNPVFALANDGDLVIQDFDQKDALKRVLVFGNVSVTAVGHNRFLTGPTPYGRAEIELKRGVLAWQWGLSLPLQQWLPGCWLVFSQTSRTSEFSSPLLGRQEGVQRWGTLALNTAW